MSDAFVPPRRPRPEFGGSNRQASRRSEPRVSGPFEGRRIGPLPTPLRVHDLSTGGLAALSDGNRGRIERTIERLLVERSRSTKGGWTFGES